MGLSTMYGLYVICVVPGRLYV